MAQINGRNAIEWNKKLEFDVWYVENLSFILDLQIMFLTLRKVINLEGINTPESVKSFIYKENGWHGFIRSWWTRQSDI